RGVGPVIRNRCRTNGLQTRKARGHPITGQNVALDRVVAQLCRVGARQIESPEPAGGNLVSSSRSHLDPELTPAVRRERVAGSGARRGRWNVDVVFLRRCVSLSGRVLIEGRHWQWGWSLGSEFVPSIDHPPWPQARGRIAGHDLCGRGGDHSLIRNTAELRKEGRQWIAASLVTKHVDLHTLVLRPWYSRWARRKCHVTSGDTGRLVPHLVGLSHRNRARPRGRLIRRAVECERDRA